MKSLYLTFETEVFNRLKALKDKSNLSWERFIQKELLRTIFNENDDLRHVRRHYKNGHS